MLPANVFNDCLITIQDDLGRLIHAVPVVPNNSENTPFSSEAPSRKMTDNYERTDSLSVLSLKDRFASSFMLSSFRLMKNQVPKTVHIDEVFEFSCDILDSI